MDLAGGDGTGDCVGGGCTHLGARPSGGGDMAGWSICLAVIVGFAVMLLFEIDTMNKILARL